MERRSSVGTANECVGRGPQERKSQVSFVSIGDMDGAATAAARLDLYSNFTS